MYYLDLSIIIVNWKSKAFVQRCLSSIYANLHSLRYEVIVVDNASYDGCGEMIRAAFPSVIFIQSSRNLGFAGANNLAFVRCRGRNVLFLNPDTEIQGPAIQKLVSALGCRPDAGMVGARLLNTDLSLQTTCVTALPSILNQALDSQHLRSYFPKWSIWGKQALLDGFSAPVVVEAISGACMLAKREILEQIGCFTTAYFMYAEDMDLCMKVAMAGARIYYVPDAVIVHHAGGSSSQRKDNNFSNIVLRESLTRFFGLYRGHFYANMYRLSAVAASFCRIALLILICPIAIHPDGYRFMSRALSKWSAIFLWSLGLFKGAKRHSSPSLSSQAIPAGPAY